MQSPSSLLACLSLLKLLFLLLFGLIVGSIFLKNHTQRALIPETQQIQVFVGLKNHLFIPSQLQIPAGKIIQLVINNQDQSMEEFESYQLSREKLIGPKQSVSLFLGPLLPGSYEFEGEFNSKSARGLIIAVEAEND